MKILKYLYLILFINAAAQSSIRAELDYELQVKIAEQLLNSNIVLNPELKLQEAIDKKDIILFLKIIKNIKSGKISADFILKNKEKYVADLSAKINNIKEFYDSPMTYEELITITISSTLSLYLAYSFILLLQRPPTNRNANMVELFGPTLLRLFGSFTFATCAIDCFTRYGTKKKLKTLKRFKKHIELITQASFRL